MGDLQELPEQLRIISVFILHPIINVKEGLGHTDSIPGREPTTGPALCEGMQGVNTGRSHLSCLEFCDFIVGGLSSPLHGTKVLFMINPALSTRPWPLKLR